MTYPTLESLQAEITALRSAHQSERSALLFWMTQTFAVSAGNNPAGLACWIRQRVELLRRSHPPGDDLMPAADYQRGLGEIMPAVASMGDVLATDLEDTAKMIAAGTADPVSLPKGPDARGNRDGTFGVIEALIGEVHALRYWVCESYNLISGGRPLAMSARITEKLAALKNEPPIGTSDMTPEDLDQAMLTELPPILRMGEWMARHLAATQAAANGKRH